MNEQRIGGFVEFYVLAFYFYFYLILYRACFSHFIPFLDDNSQVDLFLTLKKYIKLLAQDDLRFTKDSKKLFRYLFLLP